MLHCTIFFVYFLAMKSWNFHCFLMLLKQKGKKTKGKPVLQVVIMNKFNIVLFFCTNYIIFFKTKIHNYFCFFSCAFPKPAVGPDMDDFKFQSLPLLHLTSGHLRTTHTCARRRKECSVLEEGKKAVQGTDLL